MREDDLVDFRLFKTCSEYQYVKPVPTSQVADDLATEPLGLVIVVYIAVLFIVVHACEQLLSASTAS